MDEPKPKARNKRTAWMLSLLVAGMFGFGFALVPLYGLICQVTGIQSAVIAKPGSSNPTSALAATDRVVTVKFDATVNDGLPWAFVPSVNKLQVRVGQPQTVNYQVRNLADHPVTGQAIPAVAPWQATNHFSKSECFCFTRQTLEAGEVREMPVLFVITSELPEGIDSLTLSYTFMNVNQDPVAEESAPTLPTITGG